MAEFKQKVTFYVLTFFLSQKCFFFAKKQVMSQATETGKRINASKATSLKSKVQFHISFDEVAIF